MQPGRYDGGGRGGRFMEYLPESAYEHSRLAERLLDMIVDVVPGKKL